MSFLKGLPHVAVALLFVGCGRPGHSGLGRAAPLRGAEIDNLIYVSWGDQIMVAKGDAQLDAADKIERSVAAWAKHYDAGAVLWRGSSLYIKEYYEQRPTSRFISNYYAKVDSIEAKFQPLEVVRRETRKHGQRFLIYMTIFDHGAPTNQLYGGSTPFPWQDRATIEHPEWQDVDLRGTPHYGVLDFSWPEARALMVGRIKGYVERFGCDGVYVCTRTHSLPALHADQFGFGPKVVEEIRRRGGPDILSDPRFDFRDPRYAPGDRAVADWRRLRGEYLVQFYRELRAALQGKEIITGIPRGRYLGPPYGNLYLDWESIIREKLVDGLVLGVRSGAGLHPPLYVPHRQIGYLSSEDDQIEIPKNRECVGQVHGPPCRERGVRLYLQSGYSIGQAKWAKGDPNLTGFMIGCPSSRLSPRLPHDPGLNFAGGEMTIEAFLRLDAAGVRESQRVLSKYDHENDDLMRGWEWIVLPGGRFRFRINLFDPAVKGGGEDCTLDTALPLPSNQWIHVATVYDRPGRELRLYVGGAMAARRTISDKPLRVNPDQDLYIGRYGGHAAFCAEGLLDELRISTVARIYTEAPRAPYTGTEAGTLALYHFDALTDGSTCANSARGTALRAALTGMDGSRLEEGLSGFGNAFRMGE
ncbi:MAG TPA: hypothetical protein PLU30_02085 [Verrucomicrobiae bacterium]|nr:hypothetical protein [Verrucomicrobiae bacterium]